jgi:hypothetical protein
MATLSGLMLTKVTISQPYVDGFDPTPKNAKFGKGLLLFFQHYSGLLPTMGRCTNQPV